MFYPRKILPSLEKELYTSQMIVLTGMRRVGKTTIIRYLFEKVRSSNKALFDLENPLHRKVFEEEDYDAVWANLVHFNIKKEDRAFIFLDEIQNLPSIPNVAKYLYDHSKTKFFMTGSSSFYLKNLFSESMSNRKIVFELYPLTFSEFLIFKKISRITKDSFASKAKEKNKIAYRKLIPFWREYVELGGFPEVVLEENLERKRMLLNEIFTSYFERDVKTLADFKDLTKIRDLILLLADRVGSKLDIVKLSSILSLSRETVYNYLEFLQASYFISLLSKHTGSIDRKVAGGKKVYLCDTGLTNILGKVSAGQLFEAGVFENFRPDYNLSYFDKEGFSEIDFIADGKIGFEVKTSVSAKESASLARRMISAKLKEGYLISSEYSPTPGVILATDL
ncbi:hypothetical protein A2960_05490 [Candidatus Gottesmanbacteria bacterium RIFCSPLOWO2_01_FULL_39_12b]|uniref:ATPase n=1 Tax=Candidatus Gottesmanbacteria bacterium RIFCSPLOWO2_01_FULL_39_12b TaxID=1798388 RepID=A0A1F6AMP2_9BACT|nr:MAG: hypothetical protein A2960_05490 [Candidatus Gottesmanbacteria bacterium RIFCSPLOWO2_01_FULL_39_12b]